MKKLALSLFILLGVTTATHAAPPENPRLFYPESYGGLVPVVGGDGIADNQAIQAALTDAGANGGDVVLTQMYDIASRAANTSLGNPWRTFGVVVTGNQKPVLIRSEGGGGFRAVGNWYGAAGYLFTVYKNANTVTLRDVFIDMSQRCAGIDENEVNCRDEQQHAIELDYGAKHVRIEDVTIYHPSLGASAGGDCVRMLGGYTPAEVVEDVVIRGLVGLACDRSLVSFQRSVHGVTVDHVMSLFADDNDIDMEATGVDPTNELTWIQDVTLRSALIVKGGGNGITLGRGIRIRVLDSAVLGGALFSLSCRDCVIANSTFLQGTAAVDSPISIMRSSERTKVLHNRLGRLAGSTSTVPLVFVAANNGAAPRDTLVMGNDFASTYSAPALRADNADLTAIGNTFRFTGATPANQNAVGLIVQTLAGEHAALPGSLVASSNRFIGAWYAAVQVGAATGATSGPAVVTGNMFDGSRSALRCLGAVWNVVRSGNYKSPSSLDECPQATTGY